LPKLIDDIDVEFFAVGQQHLEADLRPGEQGLVKAFFGHGFHFDDLHG
jgi:hypothetical protein